MPTNRYPIESQRKTGKLSNGIFVATCRTASHPTDVLRQSAVLRHCCVITTLTGSIIAYIPCHSLGFNHPTASGTTRPGVPGGKSSRVKSCLSLSLKLRKVLKTQGKLLHIDAGWNQVIPDTPLRGCCRGHPDRLLWRERLFAAKPTPIPSGDTLFNVACVGL